MIESEASRCASWVGVGLTLSLACGGAGEATPTKPAETKAAETKPAPDEPAPDEPAPDKPAPVEPGPVEPGDDWLVWYADDAGWHTRWIDLNATGASVLGQRNALVASDGTQLWHLQRQDHDVDVLPCICMDEPDSTECTTTGKIAVPGLVATGLADAKPTSLVGNGAYDVVEERSMVGDSLFLSLEILGGVGGKLWVETGLDGYFCGAHGMYERKFEILDLATGKAAPLDMRALGRALPASVQEAAAQDMLETVKDCEEPDMTVAGLIADRIGLADVRMQLAGGEVDLEWHYETDVPYVCSADYAAHGEGHSSLVPAAAPLGLAGPLPPGLVATFGELRKAYTLGWVDLTVAGEARETALRQFNAIPDTAWPDTTTEERPAARVATATGVDARARALLTEARQASHAKDFAAAITSLDAAIAIDAAYAKAYAERGYAKLLSEDLEGAFADCTKALGLDEDPKFQAAAYFNLGLIAEKRGDTKAAKEAYRASNERRETKQARAALERLP